MIQTPRIWELQCSYTFRITGFEVEPSPSETTRPPPSYDVPSKKRYVQLNKAEKIAICKMKTQRNIDFGSFDSFLMNLCTGYKPVRVNSLTDFLEPNVLIETINFTLFIFQVRSFYTGPLLTQEVLDICTSSHRNLLKRKARRRSKLRNDVVEGFRGHF